jgi:S-adenosylmethionine uptake transporter
MKLLAAGHSSVSRPILPFAAAMVAVALFSAMDAVMKLIALEIGAFNALFWRAALSMPVFILLTLREGRGWPERGVMHLHIARNVALTASLLMFFWALKYLPIAQGIALSFVAPLIALGLAAVFLKEKVAGSAVLASLLAFAGVLVILFGQHGGLSLSGEAMTPALAVIAAAVLYAVGIIVGRPLSQRASPVEITLFFNAIAFLMCLVIATQLPIVIPPLHLWPWIIGATVAANVSIMLVAWAYARAEAQYLLPVEYSAFLWACLYGWLFFEERVSVATLAGAVLIVMACLWTARRQPDMPLPEPDLDCARPAGQARSADS